MKRVLSTSISVGLATGLYGISFGALAAVAGLDLVSIMLLSVLMFSGGSQFAFIGVIAGGGAPFSAVTSAWLLGVRNGFYAMRLNNVLAPRGIFKLAAAQLSIDESNAVSAAQENLKAQRLGFWATGISVFVFWNLATLLGALAGDLLGSAETWGLDAAAAAAFLGLVWPKLKSNKGLALAAAAVALLGSLLLACRCSGVANGVSRTSPKEVKVTLTVILASIAVFSWKLLGYIIPQRWITPGIQQFSERVTIVLLTALVAVQTFVSGNQLDFDARIPALAVAAILFALRTPYILVVIVAAAVAAGLRLLGF